MGLLDAISPTPRNRILGLLADATHGVNDFASKPFGYDNPPARMLMGLLGVPSIATTLDRLSYGEPLTNIGKANVPLLKPETADAAMAAAAALPAVSRGALKASDAAVQAITKNPQATATKVMDYAAQMNPANPMVVWHGSPHKFDKFDSSKIGTGEGAQAYGHGLYFAESPEVAKKYAENLGAAHSTKFSIDGRDVDLPPWVVEQLKSGTSSIDDMVGTFRKRISDASASKAKSLQPWVIDSQLAAMTDTVQKLEALRGASLKSARQGHLYRVDLPDDAIARMLDWEAPLSKQPEAVRAAMDRAGLGRNAAATGQDIYRKVSQFDSQSNVAQKVLAAGGDAAARLKVIFPGITDAQIEQAIAKAQRPSGDAVASSVLRDMGIPGVRYLDGGSRGAGNGTSNFVVFPGNEGLLSILERNGVPVK